MKKYLYGIVTGLVLLTALLVYYNSGSESTDFTAAAFTEFKSTDKLFTSFAYVPLIDLDYRPRDITFGRKDSILFGYCWRQYEVGIGYERVDSLISEYLQTACSDNIEGLPEPEIISTNPVSSEAAGTYSRAECDKWDAVGADGRRSRAAIKRQLIKDGQWEMIAEGGRRTLAGFIRIYCPQEEE